MLIVLFAMIFFILLLSSDKLERHANSMQPRVRMAPVTHPTCAKGRCITKFRCHPTPSMGASMKALKLKDRALQNLEVSQLVICIHQLPHQ